MSSFIPLSSVVEFIRGITFKPEDLIDPAESDAVVCMRTKNIQNELDASDLIAVPSRFVRRDELYLKPTDLLLSSANSWNLVGKAVYVGELGFPATAGGFISIVRPRPGIVDPRYLYRWITHSKTQEAIRNCGRQTTNISNLSVERFLDLKIPLPSNQEQRRVATVLDKADVIRKKQSEALRLADAFLRSVFLDIFGGLLSGSTDQWQTLNECTDFIDYRGKTPEKSDGGIRLITAKNVRDGVINIEPAEFISETTYSWWMSRGYPQSGDVLFTTEAPLGNIAVLRIDEPVAIGQRLIAIRPREMLRSDYLSWALRQEVIQRDIISRATGSTVKGIRSAELVQVSVPIPSYDDQLKFERIVASVNHQKEVMHASAVQGEQLFQALQQQAFQG